ncbi:MAG: hypothetical protein H6618_07915 [Deltaproteobacteria bacterium]|nr:hypothetical protein [Deltaproteobacteria bacterium]
MTEMINTLIKHTIVILVSRREKGISLDSFLSNMGFQVFLAESLYEAGKVIEQEMPHLVITEAIVSDGNAVILYDKLQNNEILKKIPILVHIPRKVRQDVELVASRRFAGFILGALDPKSLVSKLNAVIEEQSGFSPYYIDTSSHPFNHDLTVSMNGKVVGQCRGMVVSESGFEIHSTASLLCLPGDKKYSPVVFRAPTNLRSSSGIFNLFPINKVVGKGRLWVSHLPEINLTSNPPPDQLMGNKTVIYFDSMEDRFKQFSHILKAYNVDLVYAPSLNRCISLIRQRPGEIGCAYLHELTNDASGIAWKNEYMKLPSEVKPPLIIGTSSMNAKSTSDVRFLKRPFGMGQFLENIKAAFIRSGELTKGMEKTGYQGISVQYKVSARILGLDESGGIMEVSFPVAAGSPFLFDHKFFRTFLGEDTAVYVESSQKVDGQLLWHVRFRSLEQGASKSRYWSRLVKALEELAEDAELRHSA